MIMNIFKQPKILISIIPKKASTNSYNREIFHKVKVKQKQKEKEKTRNIFGTSIQHSRVFDASDIHSSFIYQNLSN